MDIVVRLRHRAGFKDKLDNAAAYEIERLRRALQNISNGGVGEKNWTLDEMRAYALYEYQHNNEGADHG